MEIGFDKHIIVGTLVYTQWNGELLGFTIGKDSGEKALSVCFYSNAVVCVLENHKYGRMISPELIKEMYDIGNGNITQKIKELCKKGVYRDMFKGELKDWYMSIVLGDAWN